MPYVAIHSEGGLIPGDILDQIAQESLPGQKAADFGLEKGRRLSEEISRAWSDAQDYWHIFDRRSADLPEGETGTTLTRERWVVRLFNDLLGYALTFQAAGTVVEGRTYPISHRAGPSDESPPVHIEGFRVDLDRRPPAGHRRLSPQALVQDYLNRSEQQLWGIVTNGYRLRLLRETPRTSRPAYLEFDLQSILEGSRFNEFALFYRLCHRTRLPRAGEEASKCLLETYYQESIDQGGRVRDRLRDGVEEVLKILGSGFLRHSENAALTERIHAGKLAVAEYHRQLLRLVYRLLFLMVAEERHMIVPEGPEADRRQRLYDRHYSLARLRERAEAVVERSPFSDLWLGLCQTFQLFNDVPGENPLGIPPLNGDLFSYRAMPDLEGTRLPNHELLLAMRHLCLFREKGVQQRVNYSALDVEELGSVYESLLDFQPAVEHQPEGVTFELRIGTERKSTGSYYTRPELVAELIESALVPVLEERVTGAETREEKERAILKMKVCDSASGSGHFLLAAARRMGRELAKVRTGEEEPTPREFHLAVRDVISHCIYGVDMNPLAVDLCKLSLWLEGHWTGKPLSFLDHHIKCGNSLIGVFDPEVLKQGIPDEAFNPVAGDDKKAASAIKKRNRKERESPTRRLPFERTPLGRLEDLARQLGQLSEVTEDNPADVKRKAELYRQIHESPESHRTHRAANLWTAAFFVPLTRADDPAVPTTESLKQFIESGSAYGPMIGQADSLAVKHSFFHWFLEFPDVFAQGGFDIVVGNPPWEKMQLEEEKFFASLAPDIADSSAKQRKEAIRLLETHRPELFTLFQGALRRTAGQVKFVKESGRFPLSGEGNVSTHSLFIELASTTVGLGARIGLVVPSGLATQDTQKRLFAALTSSGRLIRLLDFENRRKLFPSVHPQFRFCIVTLGPERPPGAEMEFAFLLQSTSDIREPKRCFRLSYADLCRFSPNTGSCPQLVNQEEAALLKKVYASGQVIHRENAEEDAWGWQSWQVLNETHEAELLSADSTEGDVLPLYEGKLFYQFDHRYATYGGDGGVRYLSTADKQQPAFYVRTRYFVPDRIWSERIATEGYTARWVLAFRRITNATNERTAIFCILPKCIAGSQSPVVKTKQNAATVACLLANLNSIVFDFAARRRVGGTDLNHFIIHQLPVLPPSTLSLYSPISGPGQTVQDFLLARVLELTYTAWDLEPFAEDCGWKGPPFRWNEERRFLLRCELDAAFFHLYMPVEKDGDWLAGKDEALREEMLLLRPSFPRPRDAVVYIMDTFPITRHKEEEEYGEYRTKRAVLEIYDAMTEAIRSRASYKTLLDPPPADPKCSHPPKEVDDR
jgi:hypothetical protein